MVNHGVDLTAIFRLIGHATFVPRKQRWSITTSLQFGWKKIRFILFFDCFSWFYFSSYYYFISAKTTVSLGKLADGESWNPAGLLINQCGYRSENGCNCYTSQLRLSMALSYDNLTQSAVILTLLLPPPFSYLHKMYYKNLAIPAQIGPDSLPLALSSTSQTHFIISAISCNYAPPSYLRTIRPCCFSSWQFCEAPLTTLGWHAHSALLGRHPKWLGGSWPPALRYHYQPLRCAPVAPRGRHGWCAVWG